MIHYYNAMLSRYIVCQILHEKAISVDSEPLISESVMSTALGGWRGCVAMKLVVQLLCVRPKGQKEKISLQLEGYLGHKGWWYIDLLGCLIKILHITTFFKS